MIHPSMKSPLALSIGGVGLLAGSIVALSYWNQHRQSLAVEAPAVPAASLSLTEPDRFIPSATDPWERGLEFGWEAAVAAQTASSEADWRRVGDLWLQAIAELEEITPDSPRRQEAQSKIQNYLANFDYAEGEKAKARAAAPAANGKLSLPKLKADLEAGPMKVKFASGSAAKGSTATVGQVADGRARIELVGNEENLSQVNLILPGKAGASSLTMANLVYINQLLRVTTPQGTVQSTWAADSLQQLDNKPEQPITQDFGAVQVKVSTDASEGKVVVNIFH